MRERGVDGRIEGSKMVSNAPLMISKERSRRRKLREREREKNKAQKDRSSSLHALPMCTRICYGVDESEHPSSMMGSPNETHLSATDKEITNTC